MNKLLIFLLLFLSQGLYGQRIGINTSDPDLSSVLDIRSDSLGVLIPRISSAGIQKIKNPAEGLLVYQTDERQGFYYFDNISWRFISDPKINIEDIDPLSVSVDSIENYIVDKKAPLNSFYRYRLNEEVGEVWFWNGERAILISGSDHSNFKIYSSYSSLREDTFNIYDLVYIKDFTVTKDTIVNQVKGGFFSRIPTGRENGATVLVTNGGVVYERQWNGVNIYPSWWEVGGFDHNGNKYEGDFKWHGIENNGDRLWAAASLASEGMIIECEPFGLYETSHRLVLKHGVRIHGNRATIKRSGIATTLTSTSTSGSNVYAVDDASKFRIGMWVNAFGDKNIYGDQSHGTARFYMIVNKIEGDLIYLTKNVDNTIVAGSKVTTVFDMILCSDDNHISNAIFDGNNEVLDATFSWNHLNGIVYFTDRGLSIDKCIFKNFDSDVIIGPSPLYVTNCEFINIGGSPIHGSDDDKETESSIDYNLAGVYIQNCKFSDICFATAAANGHANQIGIYAQSVGTGNIVIENCYAERGNNGGIVTPINVSSDHIKISDSFFSDFGHILTNLSFAGITGLDINNNVFYNCGVLNFEGSPNSSDKYSDTNITGNRFTNCQVVLIGSDRLHFTNNNIFYLPNDEFDSFEISKEVFSNAGGMLTVSSSNSVISNNIVVSKQFDPRAEIGIYINSRNDETFRNLTISDNVVVGFPKGIVTKFVGPNVYFNNIQISKNIIETAFYSHVTNPVGVLAANGARVLDNHIVHRDLSPAIQYTGTIERVDNLMSGWILNNICEGSEYDKQIEIINMHVSVSNNYLTGGLFSYQEDNFFGLNHLINYNQNHITQLLNRKLTLEVREGVPSHPSINGSVYIDELTGETYIYKDNVWKLITD